MNIVAIIFKDICTTKNNKDYCHSKTLAVFAFFWFIAMGSIDCYRKVPFQAMPWGGAIGSIILAAAGGAKIKDSTEPRDDHT